MGRHAMVELTGCPREVLDDLELIREAMREAVVVGRGTLLGECVHRFTPQGVTVLGLLAESHISIHTWPEHGLAAVDMFSCAEQGAPELACEFLARKLQASGQHIRTIERTALPAGDDQNT